MLSLNRVAAVRKDMQTFFFLKIFNSETLSETKSGGSILKQFGFMKQ